MRVQKSVLMVALLCGLTACSHKHNAAMVSDAGMNGAMPYGAGTGQYSADQSQGGRYVNPLTAPSHQVYYFAFDSNEVDPTDYKALSIQANYLVSHPNAKVRLEGSTDDRGSREYNVGLGWRRDQAVARLLEQQGVQPNQINMISYGKERPAAMGNDDAAFSLNRRVELVYEAE
ncbi:MAG: hypothetical protein A3J38_02505 [Gammaproteobacteria bacterium RIFCSPHIGHO2_12_FULL_45_9]|nr:MAG: hypothetical protein A3J38_02505 [Gammaproteobacteria bacterium RIFCSPHIGHO2_12_FULL_45_9]